MTGPELIAAARELALELADRAESGEDDTEVRAIVERWAERAGDKAAAYVAVARRLDDEAEIAKRDEADARTRRRTAEGHRDRVLGLLREVVEAGEALGKRADGLRLQRTTPALVAPEDVSAWPAEWTRVKIEPSASAARDALVSGVVVEGFALREQRTLYGWRRKGGAS